MISESAGGGYAAYGAEDGEGEGTRPEARKNKTARRSTTPVSETHILKFGLTLFPQTSAYRTKLPIETLIRQLIGCP